MRPTDYSYHLVHRENGEETLTVITDEGPEVLTSEHPNFCDVKRAVQKKEPGRVVKTLLNIARTVREKFQELSPRVGVRGNTVYFDGEPVESSITRQIVRFLREGVQDWRPLVKFLENIHENPTEHSREQLYDWLRARDFTITPQGFIVGYKGVRNDGEGGYQSGFSGRAFVDDVLHTGRIPNYVGATVKMPRSEVAHDPSAACSTGLHVGTRDYARSYAQGALLTVVVNPRDVVSVPTDAGGEKVRVSQYTALASDPPYQEPQEC
jgi:hypothetical protein